LTVVQAEMKRGWKHFVAATVGEDGMKVVWDRWILKWNWMGMVVDGNYIGGDVWGWV